MPDSGRDNIDRLADWICASPHRRALTRRGISLIWLWLGALPIALWLAGVSNATNSLIGALLAWLAIILLWFQQRIRRDIERRESTCSD